MSSCLVGVALEIECQLRNVNGSGRSEMGDTQEWTREELPELEDDLDLSSLWRERMLLA